MNDIQKKRVDKFKTVVISCLLILISLFLWNYYMCFQANNYIDVDGVVFAKYEKLDSGEDTKRVFNKYIAIKTEEGNVFDIKVGNGMFNSKNIGDNIFIEDIHKKVVYDYIDWKTDALLFINIIISFFTFLYIKQKYEKSDNFENAQ